MADPEASPSETPATVVIMATAIATPTTERVTCVEALEEILFMIILIPTLIIPKTEIIKDICGTESLSDS
jgi:hypothetical protein